MTSRIQSEIRVADILTIFEKCEDNFYICYVVANLLKEQIENLPGFQKFKETYYNDERDEEFGMHYGFLVNFGLGMICENVVEYFNIHIEKHFPDATVFSTVFCIDTLMKYQSNDKISFIEWNRITRIKMMERILADDPEAVISINLEVGS